LGFQRYYESIATPFEWRFTKDDLAALMQKLDFPPLCGGRRRVAEYVAEFMNQSTKTTEEKAEETIGADAVPKGAGRHATYVDFTARGMAVPSGRRQVVRNSRS
jgi:hypothetical protein